MLALITAASAATPVVVVAGDPERAVALVAERTHSPVEDLGPVDLGALLSPGLRGAASIPCGGPPVDRAGLQAALDEVVARYDGGDLAGARSGASALDAAPACLTEPVDPRWV